jgi:chaperonin cofactor prefoldin
MSGISSQQKEGSSKKREQGLKSKRGETSYEELHVTKKDDEIYKLLGEILSKERQKGDHIFQ